MWNCSTTVCGSRNLRPFIYIYIFFHSGLAIKKKMSGLVRSNCSVISMQARPGIAAPPSNEAASFYESVMPVMVHLVSLVESICKLSKAFRKILRPHICLNEFGTNWARCCSSFFSCHFETVTLFFHRVTPLWTGSGSFVSTQKATFSVQGIILLFRVLSCLEKRLCTSLAYQISARVSWCHVSVHCQNSRLFCECRNNRKRHFFFFFSVAISEPQSRVTIVRLLLCNDFLGQQLVYFFPNDCNVKFSPSTARGTNCKMST